MTWIDTSADETGFRLQRKLGSAGTWQDIATLGANTQSASDSGPLAPSSTYFYRVLAFNAGGDSTPSNELSVTTPAPTGQAWLSDMVWVSAANGWGAVERDRSNGEQGAADGRTINLNGVTYAKGLGVHATSDITYALNGQYTAFLCDIGVDDEVGSGGSLVFQAWLDGVLAYHSGTMTGASATKSINLNVSGKTTLRLVVSNAGDGNAYDHGDWAGARLLS
jgi:hypothetical protein